MTDNDPHSTDRLSPGVIAGLVAMVVGAAAYGAVPRLQRLRTRHTPRVGVGVLVGPAMIAVRPTSRMLPALAAFFSLAGAVLGQITGDTVRWAQASGVDYGTARRRGARALPRGSSQDRARAGSCSG